MGDTGGQPTLSSIADDIWHARYDLVIYGVHFPGRMTVIRLPDGALMLISPIPIDDAMARELEVLGEVRHIVAPNRFHHLHLPGAVSRYPNARVYGAPGLDRKRRDVEFDESLTDEAPRGWQGTVDQILVAGVPMMSEVVFLHRPSRSLIVTDLVFNFERWNTWLTGLVLWFARARGRTVQTMLWRVITRDRVAAGSSVRRMLQWQFDRVVMAHGEVLETGGRETAERVLAWMTAAALRGGQS